MVRPVVPIDARALRRASVIAVSGAALALTGCGSAGSSSTARTTTVTRTASPAPGATTSATSATTSGSARARTANATCRSAALAVSVGSGTAGLGHIGEVLRFRNRGSSTCVLAGYPGVALIRSSGRQVQAKRTPTGYLGGLPPGSRTAPVLGIRPGATVSALLEGANFQGSGASPCPSYVALLVTPPNLRVSRRLARPFSVCGPTVHPVVAGTTGRQG